MSFAGEGRNCVHRLPRTHTSQHFFHRRTWTAETGKESDHHPGRNFSGVAGVTYRPRRTHLALSAILRARACAMHSHSKDNKYHPLSSPSLPQASTLRLRFACPDFFENNPHTPRPISGGTEREDECILPSDGPLQLTAAIHQNSLRVPVRVLKSRLEQKTL